MGYSHFDKVSGINGLAVGAKGAEKVIADADGHLYQGGTEVTSSAAELNIMDGVLATKDEINRACDASTRIVAVTANLALTEALHDGKVMVLNKAAGLAITLPAATGSGAKFKLVVLTTFTGACTIKVVGDDIMKGTAILFADGGDTVVGFATASDTDTITFAADNTSGGIAGATVELIDIGANTWGVEVVSDASGSEATPFSATVTP